MKPGRFIGIFVKSNQDLPNKRKQGIWTKLKLKPHFTVQVGFSLVVPLQSFLMSDLDVRYMIQFNFRNNIIA